MSIPTVNDNNTLLKWQVISFISRISAMLIGILQSIVIVRVLSIAEYGLVSIVTSIGAAFGTYQHLGLASGSTREISTAKDNRQVFKIFITSVVIRYLISIPLAVVLFFIAPYLATNVYSQPNIVLPIRLFALILLVQGFQGIFNSVISGLQRFKRLFLYQVFIAFCSLIIYIPFIYYFRVYGYFYALLAFNVLSSFVLGYLALKPLSKSFEFPTKKEFSKLFKGILSLSLGIFLVKTIYTYWNKIGPLVLGSYISPEQVGIFSFALLYSTKLMAVSDSITDVNLPVLSKMFSLDINEFRKTFSSNFDKIFSLIVFVASSAVYWANELIFVLLGSTKYSQAYPLIFPIMYGFVFYSIVNILKSSIIIPAKFIKEMILSFVLMFVVTLGGFYYFSKTTDPLTAMSYGMLLGSLICLIGFLVTVFVKLNFNFIKVSHLSILTLGVILSNVQYDFFSFMKFFVYFGFTMFYIQLMLKSNFVTSAQIKHILALLKNKFTKAKI